MASQPPPVAIAVAANPPRPFWREWSQVVALAIAVAGMVWTEGKFESRVQSQIDENTRRIGVLEGEAKSRGDQQTQIDIRTVRIETKLDMLTGHANFPAKSE